MENLITDTTELNSDERIVLEELRILSTKQFLILAISTFGLYQIWWSYKAWRFFKEKDDEDIMPAVRAVFSIFFMIPLFNRILNFAQSRGYSETYNSVALYLIIMALSIGSRFHDALIVLALSTCIFFLPVLKAFNFAVLNSPEYNAQEQKTFNSQQKTLLVFGILFWIIYLGSVLLIQREGL